MLSSSLPKDIAHGILGILGSLLVNHSNLEPTLLPNEDIAPPIIENRFDILSRILDRPSVSGSSTSITSNILLNDSVDCRSEPESDDDDDGKNDELLSNDDRTDCTVGARYPSGRVLFDLDCD